MKTCPKCGKVIQNDNVRFCKECGTDLYGKNDGGIWLGDPTKDPASSTPKSPKSETPIAKIGVIAVAIVALFLILFFAFSGSDEEIEATATKTEVVEKPHETQSPARTTESARRETQREQTQTPATETVVEQQPVATQPAAETEKTEDSQKNKLSVALAKGDYKQVQVLANEGYAPAYVPLAKYYLNNNEYDDADRYAKKAKAAGQSGARAIITTLDNLGYYD